MCRVRQNFRTAQLSFGPDKKYPALTRTICRRRRYMAFWPGLPLPLPNAPRRRRWALWPGLP